MLARVIRGLPPAMPSTVTRVNANSDLGVMDKLPPELLFMILDLVDFRTLSQVSRTSIKAKAVVEAFPPYQAMMEHAGETLTALSEIRLIQHHSSSLLYRTLRSDQCVSCFDFGAFLFLPTCERICQDCLYRNCAYRVATPPVIRKTFHLTKTQLKTIPTMNCIPGEYHVYSFATPGRNFRLVSVKQAKQLAIDVHGSVEALEPFQPTFTVQDHSEMGHRSFKSRKTIFEAPLMPPGRHMTTLPRPDCRPALDYWAGVAAIRFVYLSPTGPDDGRTCRGCRITLQHYREGSLPSQISAEVCPFNIKVLRNLKAAEFRLLSRGRFAEQIGRAHV